MESNEEQGSSMKKKIVTGVAAGLATAATAGIAKKLAENGDSGGEQDSGGSTKTQRRSTRPASRPRRTSSTSRSSSSRSRPSSSRGSRSRSQTRTTKSRTTKRSTARSTNTRSSGATKTKEQLYQRAKRLNIPGRSRMTKTQLARAIARKR